MKLITLKSLKDYATYTCEALKQWKQRIRNKIIKKIWSEKSKGECDVRNRE